MKSLLFWRRFLSTEVSRQSVFPVLNVPAIEEDLDCWTLEDGIVRLSRNLGDKLPNKAEEHHFRNISVYLV
jgi:hypothetical protein